MKHYFPRAISQHLFDLLEFSALDVADVVEVTVVVVYLKNSQLETWRKHVYARTFLYGCMVRQKVRGYQCFYPRSICDGACARPYIKFEFELSFSKVDINLTSSRDSVYGIFKLSTLFALELKLLL